MINKEEQKILDLNDPGESYHYCLENKDANVKLHEDIIINNEDVIYAYLFAIYIYIAEANVERLQELVIESNNSYCIYHFAYYIDKSNKEKLFKTMLKTGDKDWINKFIRDIPISKELKELIIFI